MFYPDGAMCLSCRDLYKNCSGLPFNEYVKAKNQLDKGTADQMVICKQFNRPEAKDE